MLTVITFIIWVLYRIVLVSYRLNRTKHLCEMYKEWFCKSVANEQCNININNYIAEINSLWESACITEFVFSKKLKREDLFQNCDCFNQTMGYYRYQQKLSLFPNTYLKYLINLPSTIARKFSIEPSKALRGIVYLVYTAIIACDGGITVKFFSELLVKLCE